MNGRPWRERGAPCALESAPMPLWETVLVVLVALIAATVFAQRALQGAAGRGAWRSDAPHTAASAPAMRVAGEAQPAQDGDYVPLFTPAAVYPGAAQAQGVEGRCTVEYAIAATGATRDVRARSCTPPGMFEHAAVDAARQFKYRPRIRGGQPVAVSGVRNEFVFALQR